MKERFAISHTALQIDSAEALEPCSLTPETGGKAC